MRRPPARDPLAEARALHQRVAQGLSVAAAGREFGLSRTDASHRLRLLRLVPEVREQVVRGELAPGLARALVGLEEFQQREMADHIRRKRLTARQVEALVKAWKTGWTEPSPSVATLPLRCDPAGRGQLVIDFANLDILDGVLERLGYLP